MELLKNINKIFGFRKTQKSRSKKYLIDNVSKMASKATRSLRPPSIKKTVNSISKSFKKYRLK